MCIATFLLGYKNMNQIHNNYTSIDSKNKIFYFMENKNIL